MLEAGPESFHVSMGDDRSILGPHTLAMNPFMDLEMHRPRLVFVWQPRTVNQRLYPRWLEQVRQLVGVCDKLGVIAVAET